MAFKLGRKAVKTDTRTLQNDSAASAKPPIDGANTLNLNK